MQTTITVQQFIERHPEFIPMYTHREGYLIEDYLESDLKHIQGTARHCKLNGYTFDQAYKDKYDIPCNFRDHLDVLHEVFDPIYEATEIQVGMDATEILYSDTYGCQITDVKYTQAGKPKEITLRKYRHHFPNKPDAWMDGECELDKETLYGADMIYTLRRGGGWYAKGQEKGWGSCKVAVGYARTYLDPSF